MSLNDTEVQKQIQRLVAFINQEANTKVEEIETKSAEEFQIEKARILNEHRVKINEFYIKKEKRLELAKKIQDSNLMHKARLQVLQSREQYIEELLQEARERLFEVSMDPQKYRPTLTGLVTQGFLHLMEPEVTIKCRAVDLDLVKSVLPAALEEFRRQSGIDCNVVVDTQNFLSKDCAGGVEMLSKFGRICVNNTLDARLEQVADKMMPQIREQLFGANRNRRYHD